jgi:hypothetical protein|tara:strand:- start:199 stop:1302 length:1104 start_codon:yes stop_codon:yes gene_type:complete
LIIPGARKLIDRLIPEVIDRDIGDPHIQGEDIEVFSSKKENFRLINKIESPRDIGFVDGGNLELIGAPNFSIQLNRVYSAKWHNDKRISSKRLEFFSATYSTSLMDNQIQYKTIFELDPNQTELRELLPKEKDLSFSANDRTIMSGNQIADISRVSSIGRRFAEWTNANDLIDVLNENDILMIDGTLQTNFTNESTYLTNLRKKARNKGVILCGLSKTSSLQTTTGLSLLGSIDRLAEENNIKREWYYPFAISRSTDHDVMIFIIKLSRNTDRIFRFEVDRKTFEELKDLQINEIFSTIMRNSNDLSFIGYPYGLIDADNMARVSYDESDEYKGIITSILSQSGASKEFLRHIQAKDAHDILNMILK